MGQGSDGRRGNRLFFVLVVIAMCDTAKNEGAGRASVPPPPSPDITIHCRTCGSDDVRRDASVEWNVELQTWEIVTVYDNADCEVCGSETTLVEREISA